MPVQDCRSSDKQTRLKHDAASLAERPMSHPFDSWEAVLLSRVASWILPYGCSSIGLIRGLIRDLYGDLYIKGLCKTNATWLRFLPAGKPIAVFSRGSDLLKKHWGLYTFPSLDNAPP
jgi:hypothetical protein